MRRAGCRLTTAVWLVAVLLVPRSADAYSVLAHEAVIDAAWKDRLAPLLKKRFPQATARELNDARAFAYGGSLIQDLGYYPFGSRFFSNLVHYVRSGDFVDALARDARDVNEYAFALGALAHHVSDHFGHPIAVNRAVPIVYPKVQAKYGTEVLYADSPARHVMVEFGFDVLEVARGSFNSDAYQRLVGFEVSMDLLERAFRDTYGLELSDVFGDTDLAIGTYRHAVSKFIPDMTRLAWREKRKEILAATPDVTERDVVFTLTERQYHEAFGTRYRKPGVFPRFVVFVFKLVPKFGPFKPLAFEPLTIETERMFAESFKVCVEQYRAALADVSIGRPASPGDVDLDTGRRPARGINRLADDTYGDLLKALAGTRFAGVPSALRRNINAHYSSQNPPLRADRKARKHEREALQHLAALNAAFARDAREKASASGGGKNE